mgnify:CR=1 FL=1
MSLSLDKNDITARINKISSIEELEKLRIEYIGKKGFLSNEMQSLSLLSIEEKKIKGQELNLFKSFFEQTINNKKSDLEISALNEKLENEQIDATLPPRDFNTGKIHPISQTIYKIIDIFSSMGFSVESGPDIETDFNNFTALNIPSHHPAREMQDTFYIEDKINNEDKVLRTHTSPVQVRTMLETKPPIRIIVPGRVFRFENIDASHEHTFYQVEGLLIDKNISLAHLKGVMAEMLTRLFGKPVKVRFRPGYFPFVEPGLELDFSCLLCKEKGCRVCKHTGWIEFMGAGMVHKNVLKAGGVDPEEYQGWAFGFGLTRLVMMRYQIDDIRLLTSGDLRFLKQF